MRLDLITIFPDYFAPLELSLVGKAAAAGLLDIAVHDLRDFTHDVHRSVDDTPYGGGAGMVMKPEPWGEALDAVLTAAVAPPVLIFPSPSGEPFSQGLAEELSRCPHLVFACGRYEGIDQRVIEWACGNVIGADGDAPSPGAAGWAQVREISLGDYVLNGGEVAALAITEAVARLLPGVLGNPASLVEESYAPAVAGLLEYPVYTKPALWRGRAVPEVLLSGHHGKVAQWREEQSLALTARRRPDLLAPGRPEASV